MKVLKLEERGFVKTTNSILCWLVIKEGGEGMNGIIYPFNPYTFI